MTHEAASLETQLSHVMHNSSALFSFVLSILFIVVVVAVAIVVAVCILASFVKIFHYKSFVLPLPFAVFVDVFDCISVSVFCSVSVSLSVSVSVALAYVSSMACSGSAV